MNPQVIAEHTVNLDLLPKKMAVIIDIGCRDFEFTRYFDQQNHLVYPIDIDHLEMGDYARVYDRLAITGKNGQVAIHRTADPQATSVKAGVGTISMTLETYMLTNEIDFADLIKIDVEGLEYDIILSLTKPPAKQISWEAHLHTQAYGITELSIMEAKLRSLGYVPLKNDIYEAHGAGRNAWDNLWVLQ